MIFNLYKKRGETPLECIKRFAKKIPALKKDKSTYMGRLDPLAEGVLLVASGEDIKRKEEFLNLDKEYDFVALFGFETDTYDVLGKILKTEKLENFSEGDLIKVANIYEGERDQKYPAFSSKMIAKRKTSSQNSSSEYSQKCTDIFLLENSSCSAQSASQGIFENTHSKNSASPLLHLGEGPSEARGGEVKKVKIYNLQFHKMETLTTKELFGRLLMDIGRVKGNFRQAEILDLWKEKLFDLPSPDQGEGHAKRGVGYFLAKFSAHVSSGTYIRSIVNDMGKTLGFGATTLSIKRTRVGDFKIEESLQFS